MFARAASPAQLNGWRPPLPFLQRRLDLVHGPAFAVGDHAHLGAAADQHVRTEIILGRDDGDFRLGLPVQRQVEIAAEDLPTRAIVELDDVALGMRSDLHGAAFRCLRYFCPDGAWAFELLGVCLLAW